MLNGSRPESTTDYGYPLFSATESVSFRDRLYQHNLMVKHILAGRVAKDTIQVDCKSGVMKFEKTS